MTVFISPKGFPILVRWHPTGNPIVEIRWSYDRLISPMGFPILRRCHPYIESGPWPPCVMDKLQHSQLWHNIAYCTKQCCCEGMSQIISPTDNRTPPPLFSHWLRCCFYHYNYVIMGAIASQITSLPIVYTTVYLGADQRKHQSSASLAFVRGIHRWPVNFPHKRPVTRKMFPFDDVIMCRKWTLVKPRAKGSISIERIKTTPSMEREYTGTY